MEKKNSKLIRSSDSIDCENTDVQLYDDINENIEESHIQDYNYECENSEISFYSANESVQWSDGEAI